FCAYFAFLHFISTSCRLWEIRILTHFFSYSSPQAMELCAWQPDLQAGNIYRPVFLIEEIRVVYRLRQG
ncbi:MAG TPA: hypothetical protein PLI23_03980, partial [Thermoclostridium caenicola]|uniref:hypothetical protein n=1 Tax=Thermoclostridium caenicola TaxID=659425 RepID=UPI002C635E81